MTKTTDFDRHEALMDKMNDLLPKPPQSTRSKIMAIMAKSDAPEKRRKKKSAVALPKERLTPEERHARKKGGSVNLDYTDDEDDDDEIDDELDEEDKAYVVDDDEIEYESTASDEDEEIIESTSSSSPSENEDEDVSDEEERECVITQKPNGKIGARSESSSASDEDDEVDTDDEATERLYEDLEKQDELHKDEDAIEDVIDVLSTRDNALRRRFMLIDCRLSNKVQDMLMAFVDSILHETQRNFDAYTESFDVALVNAYQKYAKKLPCGSGKPSESACYLWLHAKTRLLQYLLQERQEHGGLCRWLRHIADNSAVDDTPMSAATKTPKRCYDSGDACTTGYALIDNGSKKTICTLWYNEEHDAISEWTDTLTRFLFLPAYIKHWCSENLGDDVTSTKERERIVDFVDACSDIFSAFLHENGFSEARTGGIAWPKLRK